MTDQQLAEQAERLVRYWLADAAARPADPAARRLASVLKDPRGLEFTVAFIDRVIRPEDAGVAARALRELAVSPPRFLPWHVRLGLRLGALASAAAPGLVVPVVRAVLRRMVGHLLIDATDARLGKAIAELRADGTRLNVNLLGEAVLGETEAARRLAGTRELLTRPDVDYVSIKVSAATAPHSPWAFEETVQHVTESLLPLYRLAAFFGKGTDQAKFINLDMEEYRDLDLTIEVFTRLLGRQELLGLSAGIVLQAYLPDALGAMMRLQDWAAARVARGGAPVKVRLVKGANLPMERVEAELHGWPLATWPAKRDTDANYKRVLRWAMKAERIAHVRLGVAGHNLFDIAYAWLLAGERGVRDGTDFEMLLGMAAGQAAAVRATVGGLLLYTPVVHPAEFDVAISYLVRRLEEGASGDNFMSAAFDLSDDERLFAREHARFLASLAALDDDVPEPNRNAQRPALPSQADPNTQRLTLPAQADSNTQHPALPAQADSMAHAFPSWVANGTSSPDAWSPDAFHAGFRNAPDTDPAVAANRDWAARITARMPGSDLGADLVKAHTISDVKALEDAIHGALTAAKEWGALTGTERGAVLRRAAVALESRRASLLEVMGSECGKTIDQADPEISEAIDFANYYARLAGELDMIDGATAEPVGLIVVTPPWNFPVAIGAGGTLAALAAGSSVILKPATQARRCGSVLAEALWEAGVPRDVLRLVHAGERDLGRRLVSHPSVGRLILTGAFETAELFRSFRPDLPLLAETSGKNALVVTPHADLDLAVKDLVYSAFGHAGQKCSAASLGILVGSVAHSRRFLDQLTDAVTSLRVGYPSDPSAQMGPLIGPASGKLLRALTELEPGERWLVEPRRLDGTGQLWSPGVKTGVRRGSEFHRVEYFGPVLGLIAAGSLQEAIEIQNETGYGLTAGLHSLDRDEVRRWLDGVEAGNLYVNRHITGAIVARQPFGGWKKSAVGAGAKAGGPNYLIGLVDWQSAPASPVSAAAPALAAPVRLLLDGAEALSATEALSSTGVSGGSGAPGVTAAELESLRRAVASDARAWASEFGTARDVSGLAAERNMLRYRPVPVWIRQEGGTLAGLLRVVAAGLRAGSPLTVSTPEPLPQAAAGLLTRLGADVRADDAGSWRDVLANPGSGADPRSGAGQVPGRVRLIGGSRAAFAEASGGGPEIARPRAEIALYAQPVTESGRVELLTFLREQAVSITAHRFGSPTSLPDGLL